MESSDKQEQQDIPKESTIPTEEDPTTFNKIEAIFKQKSIDYFLLKHAPVFTSKEAAEIRGATLASGAKAMLLKDNSKNVSNDALFYLAVMSASRKFSWKLIKKVLKIKNMRFATQEEVFQVTRCLTGAVPPFGSVFGISTLVDQSLKTQGDIINFNCGLRTHSVRMKVDDYLELEKPKLISVFTEGEEEGEEIQASTQVQEKESSKLMSHNSVSIDKEIQNYISSPYYFPITCEANSQQVSDLTSKINDLKMQIQLQFPNVDSLVMDGFIYQQIESKYPNLIVHIKLASAEILQKTVNDIKAKFQKISEKCKQKNKLTEAVNELQDLMFNQQQEDLVKMMSSFFKSKSTSEKKQNKSLKEASAERFMTDLKKKMNMSSMHQSLCQERIEYINNLIDTLYEETCTQIQSQQNSQTAPDKVAIPPMIQPDSNIQIGFFSKATSFFKKEEQLMTQPQEEQKNQAIEISTPELVDTNQGNIFQLVFKTMIEQVHKQGHINEYLTQLGPTQQKVLMIMIFFACIAPVRNHQSNCILKRILQNTVPILFKNESEKNLQNIIEQIKENQQMICHQSMQQIEGSILSQNVAGESQKSVMYSILYLTIFGIVQYGPNGKLIIKRNRNDPLLRELMIRYYKRTFLFANLHQFFQAEYLVSQYQIAGNDPMLDPTQLVRARDLDLTQYILGQREQFIGTSEREDKFFNILEEEKPLCKFIQLYSPPTNSHKHIVITISGFLSENANQEQDWKHLISTCKESQTPLFTVQWSAQKTLNLIQAAYNKLDGDGISTAIKSGSIFTMKNLISVKNYISDVAVDQEAMFRKARENARLTGQILGHALASQFPFDSYSISLIGFSLGTQVIKSCLNTLYSLKAESRIHNVYLLGGAAYIKTPKIEGQKMKFSKIVHGKIRNVHTINDSTLGILFETLYKQDAIGRKNIYDTDILNIEYFKPHRGLADDNYINLKNYDITSFCKGHLAYRDALDKIIDFIEFEN